MPNQHLLSSFKGRIIRDRNPRHAWDYLSGVGGMYGRGRFYWKGLWVFYGSLDVNTSYLEVQQDFISKPQPITLISYELESSGILDLSDPKVQQTLGFTLSTLKDAWRTRLREGKKPLQWAIIEEALKIEGFAGIKVPSFVNGANGGTNIVLYNYCEKTKKNASLKVIDDHDRLPEK